MEKKGSISDRCELNRQIKAANALLRELKQRVQQLTEAVSNAAANLGERLAALREKLLVFCYQLRFIGLGKENTVQPKLKQYAAVMQQIKQKSRERKSLLAEQKQTSRLNLFKQHDLSRQIATVTEELEEDGHHLAGAHRDIEQRHGEHAAEVRVQQGAQPPVKSCSSLPCSFASFIRSM